MRKHRANILLLPTLLVLVGLIGRALIGGVPASVPQSAVGTVVRPARAVTTKSPSASVIAAMPAAGSIAVRAEQLSPDSTVLVVAMCNLQLMAADTELSLDSDQWSALAAAVLRTQAMRHNYETHIATLHVVAPGKCRAEIPMYARAGDELRRQFIAELRVALGEATAANVLAKLGGQLEAGFANFGVSAQTLEITGDPTTNLSDVQIAQTESYWQSAEGGDRLTTRREVHFPAIEDPTGDKWDALLAMVGEASEGNGPI